MSKSWVARQQLQWIYRRTITSDLKMKHGFSISIAAHFRNTYPFLYRITFFNMDFFIITVGAEKIFIMFDDNQPPVSNQTTSGVDHLARLRCVDRGSILPFDLHPFSHRIAFDKTPYHWTFCWP